MKKQPYPITELTGGLNVNLDAVFLTDKQSPNLEMVRFQKGLLKKDLGFTPFAERQHVVNGSMEADANWNNDGTPTVNTRSAAQKYADTYSRLFTVDAELEGIKSAAFTSITDREYTYQIAVYPDDTTTVHIRIRKGDDSSYIVDRSVTGLIQDAWNLLTGSYVETAGGALAYLSIVSPAAQTSGSWYVDEASIKCEKAVDERPMLIDTYYQIDGDEYLMLITVAKAYQYNTTTKTFDFITSSNVFTGDGDDIFHSAVFDDLFIVTNGKDPIQKFNGATWAALGGLAASVILAKNLVPFMSHLILGHTIESGAGIACPQRVRWSDTGDPEAWTTGHAGYVDLIDTADWVVGFLLMKDKLFVVKERSIWELVYVGGTKVFEPRVAIDGIGSYAPHTFIALGEKAVLHGSDNIYTFDMQHLSGIGDELLPLLYDTETKLVNASKLPRSPAIFMEETGDIIFVFPTSGDEPDWMLKYNLYDKTWSQRHKEVTCLGYYSSAATRVTWDDEVGSWDDAEGSWESIRLPPGAPTTLIGLPDGRVVEDDRVTKSDEQMIWETKDFIFGHAARITEVRVQAKGDDFDIGYSIDGGFSWSSDVTLSPKSEDFSELVRYLNLTVQKIRFRIRTHNGTLEIKWIEPWYLPRVRSKKLEV